MMSKFVASALMVAGLLTTGADAVPSMTTIVDESEWPLQTLVYPEPFGVVDSAANERVWIQLINEIYYFRFEPRDTYDLLAMVVSLNTDRDSTTGSQTAVPVGGDYIIDLNLQWSTPTTGVTIVQGCQKTAGPAIDPSCITNPGFTVTGTDLVITSTGGVMFQVAKSRFATEGLLGLNLELGEFDFTFEAAVKKYLDNVNVDVVRYNEPELGLTWIPYYNTLALPACGTADTELRAAVVFSEVVQQLFFQDKAYAQLYAAMQYQIMQAGMSYDRVTSNDLMDISKMCGYQVIVIPYLANVNLADEAATTRAVFLLRYMYGVGIVSAGDFITNSESGDGLPGDPYDRMSRILGITDDSPVYAVVQSNLVTVSDTSSAFQHLSVGDTIADDSILGYFTNMYVKYTPNYYTSALTVNAIGVQNFVVSSPPNPAESVSGQFNAILTSETTGTTAWGTVAGRVCHFATLEIMANNDVVWPCIQWIAKAKVPVAFSLLQSRFKHLMTMRNDCDQSSFGDEIPVLYADYNERFLQPWYRNYNFVGSYYINIGDNVGDNVGRQTDWAVSGVFYQEWLDTENELGSHSYNHPHDINILTYDERAYEFGVALQDIKTNMSLARAYSAQPGATEDLFVTEHMMDFHSDGYFSGGYSGVRAGYPGCFGFVDDSSSMVYVAPNYFFDFTMIGFYKWTAEESLAHWQAQITNNTQWANQAIGHWPIHDYGPGNWGYGVDDNQDAALGAGPGYTEEMFEGFIKQCYDDGHEFATTLDLSDRIRATVAASVSVVESSGNYQVTVTKGGSHSLGKHSLALMESSTTLKISSVGSWYAYNDDKVFLPENGGTFTVSLSSSGNSADTHITELPMRADLHKLEGDGTSLAGAFTGRGVVRVQVNPSASLSLTTASATTVQTSNSIMLLNFTEFGTHEFSLA